MGKMIKKDGFDFIFDEDMCQKCKGNCCIGESGYIWISPNEIKNMVDFLQIDMERFKKEYLRKVGYKYSLKEKSFKNGYACIFFDGKKMQCGVYEVRPNQCRTFPFWDYFKLRKDELERECPGVLV